MLFGSLSLADVVTPSFIFLISLTYQRSFDRRFAKNGPSTYRHFVLRYVCLMGMGSIMVSAEYLLVHNGRDPFVIQTVLMFAVLAFLILSAAAKLIQKIPERIRKLVYGGLTLSLCLLGVIGLIMGLHDDVVVFFLGGKGTVYEHWSILHQIGMTGLLSLPFVRMKWKGKLVSWITLCAVYTGLQQLPGMLDKFNAGILGGVHGTFGFLIVLLGGLLLMELYYMDVKTAKFYIAMTLALGVLSYFGCRYLTLDVGGITSNYMVFALFFDAVLFAFVNLFNSWQPRIQYLVWWGRNPLVLFGLGLILRVLQKMWHPSADTGLLVACAFTFGSIGLLSVIAYLLYKNKKILKL
jgi:hypothetical protein